MQTDVKHGVMFINHLYEAVQVVIILCATKLTALSNTHKPRNKSNPDSIGDTVAHNTAAMLHAP